LIDTILPPLQRWLLFSGVLLLVGAVSWRSFVGPWQPPSLRAAMRQVEVRLTPAAGWVALLLIPVWLLRLGVQVRAFRDPFAPLTEDLHFLLFETFWGAIWLGQGIVLLFLCWIFRTLGRTVRNTAAREREQREAGELEEGAAGPEPGLPWVWKGAWIGVILLVCTLSLSSHAVSVPVLAPLAVAMDGLHALAAGAWMGTLALILWLRPRGPGSVSVLAGQLRSFSYLAMAAVSLLLAMGLLLAGLHLGEVQSLWVSGYGRVLSLKILAAGVVLFLGFRNWRVGLPVLDDEAGARSVRRRASLEVGAAAIVVLLTAILVGMPMPEGVH
jgi:putative copper export protein